MSLFKTILLSLLSLIFFLNYSPLTPSEDSTSAGELRKGNVVDNFSVSELLARESGTIAEAEVGEIAHHSSWIFEKGPGLTPEGSENRSYETMFSLSEARYICWELTMEHTSVDFHRNLDFEFRLLDEEKNIMAENKMDSWIPSGQEITDHSACWGYPYPGSWNPGSYYFEVNPGSGEPTDKGADSLRIPFEVF